MESDFTIFALSVVSVTIVIGVLAILKAYPSGRSS